MLAFKLLFTLIVCVTFSIKYTNCVNISVSTNDDQEKIGDDVDFFGIHNKSVPGFYLKSDHPHAHLTPIQLIEKYNYPAQTHKVITDDGYILTVHRMVGRGKSFNDTKNRKVVLLQHGLMCSSMDWLLAGPERGFGFLLADRGYDVWMGNFRGNVHSRDHIDKNITKEQFWDFSWHEMGYYDIPAKIDHILNHTKVKKIFLIGHSQGSTAFLVALSEKPQYNNKIEAAFSLAPIAYSAHMKSPIFKFIALFTSPLETLSKLIGVYEFSPSTDFFKKFSSLFCQKTAITLPICSNAIFLICGFDKKQLDLDLLPALLHHVPAGSSIKQLTHYGQLIRSGQFTKFDYGYSENLKRYKQYDPPSYDLKNVKAPFSLHYSSNDLLSHPKDVEHLYSQLSNKIGKFHVPYPAFNHMDYMWGLDVKRLLYDKVIGLLKHFR